MPPPTLCLAEVHGGGGGGKASLWVHWMLKLSCSQGTESKLCCATVLWEPADGPVGLYGLLKSEGLMGGYMLRS